MMKTIFFRFLCLAVVTFIALSKEWVPGSDIQIPEGTTLLKTGTFGSKLYKINSPSSVYADAPLLLDLHGPTSYAQGFDTGNLLGNEFLENYDNLMKSLLGESWWEPAAAEVIGVFLDWQWNNYIGVQLPDDFLQELKGMTAGGHAAGLKKDIGKFAARGITLANLPGDLEHFVWILQDEKDHPPSIASNISFTHDAAMEALRKLKNHWAGLTCSMFGVWGSRTENGKLFTGRNLDWLKDTGISKYKLITVHHPLKGYAHATIGWAGIWGAITGMSSQGITVHEANLESDDITFRGFPWVLRLRHVMTNAKTIDEAVALWAATNNTVGFNHGFGSAKDGRAVVLETMQGNTAVFGSNDVRERSQVTKEGQQIGAPREEAVYRTNHGYDAYTLEHYADGAGSFADSIERYLMFPEAFDSYEAQKKAITYVEAVNITSVLGSKGDTRYVCSDSYKGSNILSVTFDPASLVLYSAWESGAGKGSWAPASCSTYLRIDLSQFF